MVLQMGRVLRSMFWLLVFAIMAVFIVLMLTGILAIGFGVALVGCGIASDALSVLFQQAVGVVR